MEDDNKKIEVTASFDLTQYEPTPYASKSEIIDEICRYFYSHKFFYVGTEYEYIFSKDYEDLPDFISDFFIDAAKLCYPSVIEHQRRLKLEALV